MGFPEVMWDTTVGLGMAAGLAATMLVKDRLGGGSLRAWVAPKVMSERTIFSWGNCPGPG